MKNKVLLTVPIISCLLLAGCQFIQGDVGTISNEQTNQAAGTLDNIEVNPEVEVGVTVDNSENITNETTSNMTIDIDEYESLKQENIALENENQELKKQLGNNPSFEFKTLGLYIDGESIPINSNNSVFAMNGVNYYSEDVVNKLILDNKNITVNDDGIYIGRVVADRANLFDKWIVNQYHCEFVNSIHDSYGNIHTDALLFNYAGGSIIYNLNSEYSFLKLTIATSERRRLEGTVNIVIETDDEVVYSVDISKTTKPITEEIVIDNCSLLAIKVLDSRNNTSYYSDCIISDAILYN